MFWKFKSTPNKTEEHEAAGNSRTLDLELFSSKSMASRVLAARLRPLLRSTALLRPIPSSHPLDPRLLRCLSTFPPRRPPSRPRPVDIGARARQLQSRRLWTYALTFGCVAGFIVIVLANFQDQLVFYITPSDAVQKFTADPSKARFRLGGLVLEGSVVYPNSSPEMEFVITDLITDIIVRFEGSLPDLFREGHSVVVEGFVRPAPPDGLGSGPKVSEKARGIGCFFKATEVLAKHDEKYMPKEVAAALEKNKKLLEAETETKAEARAAGDGETRS